MKPEKNNTFCYYPFYQLALKQWSQDGIVNAAPCCNAIRPENEDPLEILNKVTSLTAEGIFHGAKMNEIRDSMLNGEKHPACATCWKIEERGSASYRLYSSSDESFDKDEELLSQQLADPELTCIDFGFGDNCNLRCRMCQPGLSNKLRKDYKYFSINKLDSSGIDGFSYAGEQYKDKWLEKGSEHNSLYWPDKSFQWDEIVDNIHKIKKIRATGGETTISKPFIEFIDAAIKRKVAKDIYLDFHTNATKFTDELIDKLLQFKGMHLHFSIDSFGKNYEYIRYPMTWDALDTSVNNFLEKTKEKSLEIRIQFTVVLSVLNAFELRELHNYFKKLSALYQNVQFDFWVDFLWPEKKYINVKFLDSNLKKELIDFYNTVFADDQNCISHIVSFLEQHKDYPVTDDDRKNMLREIQIFDQARNQHYKDYLSPKIITFLETEIK